MGIRMVAVEEFHNVEPTAVHIEMDVALLKIGCDRLPDAHARVTLFYGTPGAIADTLAVYFGRHEKQHKLTPLTICFDDQTTSLLPTSHNTVSVARADSLVNYPCMNARASQGRSPASNGNREPLW